MKKISDVLNESWHEQFSAATDVEKYKSKWVHFTNGAKFGDNETAPKLGINPKKSHADPHGIYFYPASFINNRNLTYNSQFAVSSKYYYICEPTKNARILDLSRLDYVTAHNIAYLNGFGNAYKEVANQPEIFMHKMHKKLYKEGGAILYATADWLINNGPISNTKEMTWFKAFAGYDGLKDTKGIINDGEPKQMVIFSKKNVKIIKFGENKDYTNKIYRSFYEKGISALDDNNNCKVTFLHGDMIMDIIYKSYPVRVKTINTGLHVEYMHKGLVQRKSISTWDMGIDNDYTTEHNTRIVTIYLSSYLDKLPPNDESSSFPFKIEDIENELTKRFIITSKKSELIPNRFQKGEPTYKITFIGTREGYFKIEHELNSPDIHASFFIYENYGFKYSKKTIFKINDTIEDVINTFFDSIINDTEAFDEIKIRNPNINIVNNLKRIGIKV